MPGITQNRIMMMSGVILRYTPAAMGSRSTCPHFSATFPALANPISTFPTRQNGTASGYQRLNLYNFPDDDR
ncbi:hypothetical protein BV898_12782 [Hypsibius exemplaris]|uniref:Uncharacterized protein n=1 Tax=Hypsibius exemplaris TaxID=2072580 RepID=A0A1W0WCK6_HYPEX|nr:hypothetical protein BV898_12782 [Hypsibius exemplaris]